MQRDDPGNAHLAKLFKEVDQATILVHQRFFVLHVHELGLPRDDSGRRFVVPRATTLPGTHDIGVDLCGNRRVALGHDIDLGVGGLSLHCLSKLSGVVTNAARRWRVSREEGYFHVGGRAFALLEFAL
jgi:hypothetical protein